MTINVSATTQCDKGCTYCYEEPARTVEDVHEDYDVDAIIDRLRQFTGYRNEPPGLHGGEPLLMPIEDMRKIFEFVHEEWGSGSSVQTAGNLITEEHIELFKEFNSSVGVSVDGPVELNKERKARNAGREDITDQFSVETMRNIVRLREEGVRVGIITVLTKTNAGTDEKLEKLLSWMDNLNRMGVSGHFNPAIPYEDVQTDISLSPERLKEVYLRTWEWMKEKPHRKWNPHRRYVDNLLGVELGNCVNNKCDVFNTKSAKIVKGDGETTGCGKTWSTVGDGAVFLQGPSSENEYEESEIRYDMLKQVPKEEGGCKGCKYWNVCQGGCPSSGEDFDWRNKTIWCPAKYALYEKIEKDLRALMPNIRLVSDLPWDSDASEYATRRKLDIKPFVAMDPAEPGRSTSYGYAEHDYGTVEETVPDEILPDRSWGETKQKYKEEYGEESVVVDEEKRSIHADSDMGNWRKKEAGEE